MLVGEYVQFQKDELINYGEVIINMIKTGDVGRVIRIDDKYMTISLNGNWFSIPCDYKYVKVVKPNLVWE